MAAPSTNRPQVTKALLFSKGVPCVAGDVYVLNCAISGSAATSTGIYVRVNFGTAVNAGGFVTTSTGSYDTYSNLGVTTGWQTVGSISTGLTVTVPSGSTYMNVFLYNYIGGPLWVTFDDVYLVKQTPTINILNNAISSTNSVFTSGSVGSFADTNAGAQTLTAQSLAIVTRGGELVIQTSFKLNCKVVSHAISGSPGAFSWGTVWINRGATQIFSADLGGGMQFSDGTNDFAYFSELVSVSCNDYPGSPQSITYTSGVSLVSTSAWTTSGSTTYNIDVLNNRTMITTELLK
jgi:hypothetical protein